MNIQLQSQMRYGDEAGLQDFAFVHRLVHHAVDDVIAARGRGSMPNATLDGSSALAAWSAAMRGERELTEQERHALRDWLQWHAALHQDEYSAFGLGFAPDLGVVDFGSEEQFNDWMYAHDQVHDTLNRAAGLS